MCGINGFNWNDESKIDRMNELISYRGPDAKTKFTDNNISLGHLRLAIIDLSKDGIQPMWNNSKDVCIVFNGEIYNYAHIRQELENKGYKFRTKTDTEVIIYSYKEWGFNCVQRFNGMWAFAIYDMKRKTIFLSRDRTGVKPLYYYHSDKKFIFSSEIKSFLAHDIDRELNLSALDEFISFRYNYTDKTLIKNILQVMPAENIVYNMKTDSLKKNIFWDIEENIDDDFPKHAVNIRDLVEKSVRLRFVGDVKLGTYLSGGIDSSIVSIITKKYQKKKFFSIVATSKDTEKTEEKYAKIIARRYNIQLVKKNIDIDNYWEKYVEAVWYNDYPIIFPANIPQMQLAEESRRLNSIIMLSGEGGDELFAGYERHKGHSNNAFWRAIRNINSKMPDWYNNLAYYIIRGSDVMLFKDKTQFVNRVLPENITHSLNISFLQYYTKKRIYSPKMRRLCQYNFNYVKFRNPKIRDSLNKTLYLEIKTYLRALLHKQDRMNMAHAIEARVPLLDYNIIEYSFRIPGKMKRSFNNEKIILKEAFKRELPVEIITRKKEGFLLPYESFYNNKLEKWFFKNSKILELDLFDRDKLRRLFNKGNIYYLQIFFSLEIWYRLFFLDESIGHIKKSIKKV